MRPNNSMISVIGATFVLAMTMGVAVQAIAGVDEEEAVGASAVEQEESLDGLAQPAEDEHVLAEEAGEESSASKRPVAGSSVRPMLLPGARVAMLFPTGKVSLTGAFALELQWRSPVHDRRLGLSLDVGWYRIAGEGSQIDPGQGVFHFRWSAHGMPVNLGLVYEPPVQHLLAGLLPGLWPFVETGMALVPVISYGTFSNEEGHVFLQDNQGFGLAFGLYLGAGAAHALGPGEITGLYRWTTAHTDMNYPWINPEGGDLYGSQIFVGYRLAF